MPHLTIGDVLGFLILWTYIAISILGWAITLVSYRSPRYHPVVTFMASGMGVPTVGLLVIRAARLGGWWQNANDAYVQLTLLVCFAYTAWVWFAAFNMIRREVWPKRSARVVH